MCKRNQIAPTITKILEENVQNDMNPPINHLLDDAYLVASDVL